MSVPRWYDLTYRRILSLDEIPHRYPYAWEYDDEGIDARKMILGDYQVVHTVDDDTGIVYVLDFPHSAREPEV